MNKLLVTLTTWIVLGLGNLNGNATPNIVVFSADILVTSALTSTEQTRL